MTGAQFTRLDVHHAFDKAFGVEPTSAIAKRHRAIAAINAGQKPDDKLSGQAKLRSKQNTFMAVPLVFLMISNHFPGVTYGDRYNWIVLAVLVLDGWVAAKFIRRA